MTENQSEEQPTLILNEDGTHVLTVAESGVPWLCPRDFYAEAVERGYRAVSAQEYQAAQLKRERDLERAAAQAVTPVAPAAPQQTATPETPAPAPAQTATPPSPQLGKPGSTPSTPNA